MAFALPPMGLAVMQINGPKRKSCSRLSRQDVEKGPFCFTFSVRCCLLFVLVLMNATAFGQVAKNHSTI